MNPEEKRAWMRTWPQQVDQGIRSAAEAAGMQGVAVAGFDGDGWVWKWSEKVHDTTPVLLEMSLRAWPDLDREILDIDVLGVVRSADSREALQVERPVTWRVPLRALEGKGASNMIARPLLTIWKLMRHGSRRDFQESRNEREQAISELLDLARENRGSYLNLAASSKLS